MKKILFLVAIFFTCGILLAGSDIAEFATEQEQMIQERVNAEQIPLRRQQAEFLYRQHYSNRLSRERKVLLQSGKLTTEKVEALRAERQKLVEQLEALDQQITEASMEAPEIIELQAIIEANNDRIEELRRSIMPETAAPTQIDAEP
ncbi:MAG: hypothetical protein J6V91_03645 [Kiritimatiellae bacterium]|nr:hypothetical protein [Kiritimatiellia bacterium]